MLNPLKKFYRLAPNGKQELLGVDGLEHAFISGVVMLIVPLLVFVFFGSVWLPFSSVVTFVVLTVLWFFVEQFQERAMVKKDPNRPVNFWRFWKWSKARLVDMYYRLPFDSLVLVFIVWMY